MQQSLEPSTVAKADCVKRCPLHQKTLAMEGAALGAKHRFDKLRQQRPIDLAQIRSAGRRRPPPPAQWPEVPHGELRAAVASTTASEERIDHAGLTGP